MWSNFLTQEGKHVPAKGVSDAGVFITNAEPVTEKGVSADPVEKIVIFAVSGNHLAYVADTGNGDIRLKNSSLGSCRVEHTFYLYPRS